MVSDSGDVAYAVGLYSKWSAYAPENDGILVAYASIHGGTAEVAEILAGRVMKEMFSGMKNIELVEPAVTILSRLKDDDMEALEALVSAIV